MKGNFYKNKTKRDVYASDCISCRKQYYNENREKTKKYYEENRDKKRKYYNENQDKIKKYRNDNKDKINEYYRKRKDSDLDSKIACNLRSRTSKAFKAQNVKKTNKTFDLLGCSHPFFRERIIHHLYGIMTIENYGWVWQIDHCLPIVSFNLLDENDMKKCFNWVNLWPMYSTENNSKNVKIDYHLYLMQEIKAYQFIRINEERFNENLH